MTTSSALPRLVVLTDRTQLPPGRGLVEAITRCAAAGLTHVVLRELDLPEPERVALTEALSRHVRVITARTELPGACGVHLAADQASPSSAVGLRGRSCHTIAEVGRAVTERVDYITVSPVAVTRSKPGYGPALGDSGVRQAVRRAEGVPVLALGGVEVSNAARMRASGAYAVAVMGAVMRAEDPAAVVARLLQEVR